MYWDLPAALHHIRFFSKILRLPYKEEPYLRPFHLLPHQVFVQGSLFGWKKRQNPTIPIKYLKDGRSTLYRRFQYVYNEEPKGSGKSPRGAGTAIYMGSADGEPQAQCLFAAGKKEQAMIAFSEAVALRENSPEIAARLEKSGSLKLCYQLTYTHAQTANEERLLGSYLKPISSEEKTQSGFRPHFALFDEVHEIDRPTVVEMIRKAIGKNRTQPMVYEITNSGANRNSLCYEHRMQAEKMLDGTVPNDSLFAYICGLDEAVGTPGSPNYVPGDIPMDVDPMEYLLAHEELWVKANPGIVHGLPSYDYVRQQIKDAIGLPSQRNLVMRLHFCVWTDALTVWIPDEMWMSGAESELALKVDHPIHGQMTRLESDLIGKRCYGGIDLARSNDWSALFLVFPDDESGLDPNDQVYSLLEWYWIDEETFQERLKKDRMLDVWRRDGWLTVTPGGTFNPGIIRHDLLNSIVPRYPIEGIAYDRTFAHQLVTNLSEDGLTMVEWAQTFMMMGSPVAETLRRARARLWRHRGHPITRWMMRNVQVVTDPGGLQMLDKKRSTEKIDGPAALQDALGWCMRANTGERKSAYEREQGGVVVIEGVSF